MNLALPVSSHEAALAQANRGVASSTGVFPNPSAGRRLALFVAWDEPGHYFPLFSLARKLLGVGVEVLFMGGPRTAESCRQNNLRMAELPEALRGDAGLTFSAGLQQHQAEALDTVERLRPKVVVLDPLFWRFTVALTQRGISCVHGSPVLPDELDQTVPPWHSHHVPRQTLYSRWLRRAQWAQLLAMRTLDQWLGGQVHANHHRRRTRALLDAAQWPAGWAELRAYHKPSLGVPELVLCPRAFEYPFRASRASRFYVESCVDTQRTEVDDCTPELDSSKPLVLASLGSQAHRYTEQGQFFDVLLSAAHTLGEYQFVISTGANPCVSRPPTSNVIVRSFIPQLSLLRRARAMVTQGGLGSIKECIELGVPTCVVPMGFDQPSVAARVAYHGLGIVLPPRSFTAAKLVRALRTLVELPHHRDRTKLMGLAFRQAEHEQPSLAILEALVT